MSKERARRREAREQQAAVDRAAREAAARRRSRRQALVRPITGPLGRVRTALSTGKQTGPVAQRKRMRMRMILALLFFAQLVVWVVRPDWEARLAALVVAVFVFPVAVAFSL